jgi:hypothetical protein
MGANLHTKRSFPPLSADASFPSWVCPCSDRIIGFTSDILLRDAAVQVRESELEPRIPRLQRSRSASAPLSRGGHGGGLPRSTTLPVLEIVAAIEAGEEGVTAGGSGSDPVSTVGYSPERDTARAEEVASPRRRRRRRKQRSCRDMACQTDD